MVGRRQEEVDRRRMNVFYNRALENGLIEPFIHPGSEKRMDELSKGMSIPSEQAIALAVNGHTAHNIEQHFDPQYLGGEESGYPEDRFFELARITIPFGNLGIMRSCEVDWLEADGTNNLRWETSRPNTDPLSFKFHVRIQPQSDILGPQLLGNFVANKNAMELPGVPYNYTSAWRGGWRPMGNVGAKVFWPIPQGHHVRLFGVCDVAAQLNYLFGGRFTASLQTMESMNAQWMGGRTFGAL